jgi:hypothetical protein
MLRTAAVVVLLVLGGYGLLRFFARRAIRRAARGAFRTAYEMYSQVHDWRQTQTTDFKDIDLDFYARTQAWLESQGFRMLADLENVSMHQITNVPRSFIRMMIGPDGHTAAGCYHLRLRHVARKDGRLTVDTRECHVVEFVTYLDDGRTVTTTPVSSGDLPEPRPGNLGHHMPGAAPETLLARHPEHVGSLLSRSPGVAPCAMHSPEDLLKLMADSQARSSEYRRQIGFLTDDEVDRFAGRDMPRATREAIRAEVAKLCH